MSSVEREYYEKIIKILKEITQELKEFNDKTEGDS